MNKMVLMLPIILSMGASVCAMEQKPAMQHAFRHGGQAQVHRGNARTEVRSQKQQKAALQTTGFYGMQLKKGAGSALVALTVLMAISAAVQPAHAYWTDKIGNTWPGNMPDDYMRRVNDGIIKSRNQGIYS
ncbi:MAG: hypothetical protein UU47_C0012G0004 [candidate division TM6 bacterium GW2011_GWE2_41_16]|nr:MAG: hypothetical protein UU47_C0012G0004 [candidate division TM6 bacterium GW2011_GWE2_41_16]